MDQLKDRIIIQDNFFSKKILDKIKIDLSHSKFSNRFNTYNNNGTGFYDKISEDKYELNTHVGFKENRAIVFDSKIYHTSLQFNEGTGTRYCLANFIN